MKELFDGVVRFRDEDYADHRELFENLGDKQYPHTLFVGCSDSRVVPNLITRTMPGELFVVRNIANMVPPYRETSDYVATTSAVEYAVNILKVQNIVICGHSNCGGCSALYQSPEFLSNVPKVKKWLELAEPVKKKASEMCGDDPGKREWVTEQVNVIHQVRNLLTYPYIKERVNKGELNLYGWYYIIATGEVYNYNFETGYFDLISNEQ
ncbi:MAG: carbonic anhydrase [Geovibrio sp.]|nr:carbonic anhydrase [Geovibrio sp.]